MKAQWTPKPQQGGSKEKTALLYTGRSREHRNLVTAESHTAKAGDDRDSLRFVFVF